MKPTVYLAGPIGGLTEGEAKDWRAKVTLKLNCHFIRGVSPLRCEPAVGGSYHTGGYPEDKLFGTIDAIGSKNEYDVRNCDMMLAYLPMISNGTMIELGMAFALRKPIIVVSPLEAIQKHAVVNYCAGWMLEELDEAVEVASGILGVYT